MNTGQILLLIVQLAQAGTALLEQIAKASALVKKMQDENRDATPEEWAELEAAFAASEKVLADAIAKRRESDNAAG